MIVISWCSHINKEVVMNKRIKLIVILATVAIMALLLTACGSDKEKAFIGKWEVKSMEMGGITLSADDIKSLSEGSNNETFIELKSGGKAEANLLGEKSKLKWSLDEKDSKKIVIDDGKDKMNGTLVKDDELKLESKELGFSMTFNKMK